VKPAIVRRRCLVFFAQANQAAPVPTDAPEWGPGLFITNDAHLKALALTLLAYLLAVPVLGLHLPV
jgi:hypothetical protein